MKVIISISLRPRSPFIISQTILKIKVLIKDEYYFKSSCDCIIIKIAIEINEKTCIHALRRNVFDERKGLQNLSKKGRRKGRGMASKTVTRKCHGIVGDGELLFIFECTKLNVSTNISDKLK